MKISYNWLKQYMEDPDKLDSIKNNLLNKLTFVGLEANSLEDFTNKFSNPQQISQSFERYIDEVIENYQ